MRENFFRFIRGAIFIISFGYLIYFGAPVISYFTGWWQNIDIEVKSNQNMTNTKGLVIEVTNDSKKFLDHLYNSNNISVKSNYFYLIDSEGNILKPDGRTEYESVNLKRGNKKSFELIFVDDENRIDDYNQLVLEYGSNHTATYELPAPEIVKSDLELLYDMFSTENPNEQKEVADELHNKMVEEIKNNFGISDDEKENSVEHKEVKNNINAPSGEQLSEPKEIRASHILIGDYNTAVAILNKIKNGEDFGQLALDFSIDPSAQNNSGDLGYFGRGIMNKEFDDTAFKMKVGDISEPIKADYGYHIIKVTDIVY